ncbi:MAG: ABC transporter ATP-binding protein [Chloroflexi bacterium]|nr:ABC transporter ATP-binding protein [Chloroflexota bacterium]MCI0574842.1 ABC transporter ATP-binding protein [Chloroflexota bacterium]MCI0645940.1 ABC transporter ATP-binding protein [Chloroflexota bacterium]MCI0730445.1 ABC transporter ATP-binding protein [Chloroflexota bacterium]
METVIEVQQLRKVYGQTVAVDDVSLRVGRGEIFGIVGPNGAGKTTTVESVVGLRRPDGGLIRVLGLDPQKQRTGLAQRIGIQLQQAALPWRLKVWEALDLYATFYTRTVPWEPLLEQWGLAEKRNAAFSNLSGGQKQRLFIALALVNDPEIVILDELTTGLDPQARRNTWDLVRAIREQGKTVVLVTHFMDEAEVLCDRLAIIDHGTVIALDTPQQLIRWLGTENRVVFEANGGLQTEMLSALPPVTKVERHGQRVVVYGRGDDLVSAVVSALGSHGVPFQNLRTEQPNLEDVFLALTGRQIRE